MKHEYITPETCTCSGDRHCMVCDGGLGICRVCGLAEGSLTTDCPGARTTYEDGEEVYAGKKDFVDGQWVQTTSQHSPAYWRQMRNQA